MRLERPAHRRKITADDLASTGVGLLLGRSPARQGPQLHTVILRDDLSNLIHGQRRCTIEIIVAQHRKHLAADIAHLTIGQDASEAISPLDDALPILHSCGSV